MLHLLPEAAILQMGIVKQRLRRTHRPPGKPALLGRVINFLRRQAGDEVGEQIVDDMRRVRRDDRRVLIFGVLEIAGHAVTVHQVREVPDVARVQPAGDQRGDVAAVLGAELGAVGRAAA